MEVNFMHSLYRWYK